MTRPTTSALSSAALFLFTIVASACHGEQALRDDCPTAGAACPACKEDADCTILSNECHETATCTSVIRQPALAVDQIGCNMPYDRPPATRCGCVAGVCRSR